MHSLAMLAVLLLALSVADMQPSVTAETEYFPGLRKPPPGPLNIWNTNGRSDEKAFIIAQLTGIIEDTARRRFQENQRQIQHTQQILRQQQAEEYQQNRLHHKHDLPTKFGALASSLGFRPSALLRGETTSSANNHVYHFGNKAPAVLHAAAGGLQLVQLSDEPIPFAVGPDDPRYYESNPNADILDADASASNVKHRVSGNDENIPFIDAYEEMLAAASAPALIQQMQQQQRELPPPLPLSTQPDGADTTPTRDDYSSISNVDGIPSFKLKAPMEIKPKVRDDINLLVQKLQSNGQAGAIINTNFNIGDEPEQQLQQPLHQHGVDVVRKHMDMSTVVDMYVVAIIAGISATVTVGMIAIGIGWYTLHKKSLAAADVEYPAYGVTGPNKDISPSGDRRLAQSAQMYHYQHQKNLIIATENRAQNEHRNGSLTDAESDEENEEGDYTVYECPGLAPTGEMEVKNPLFLDDPTPATPATNSSTNSKTATDNTNAKTAKK